jgi:hypothetical protein
MTAGNDRPARPAFLGFPELGAEHPVHDLIEAAGQVAVQLAPGLTVHVYSAAQARALADAFTKAARLLTPRIDGSVPATGGKL